MTGKNITTVSPAALERARQLTNPALAPTDDGGSPNGQVAVEINTNVSDMTSAEVSAEIKLIMGLAHTGRIVDADLYESLQPRLHALVLRKVGMPAETSPSPARTPAPVTGKKAGEISQVIDHSDFPSWPDDQSLPAEIYRERSYLWNRAAPLLAREGFNARQAQILISLIRASDEWALEHQAAHREQTQLDTKRALERRFGPDYQRHVDVANRFARETLPGGKSRALMNTQLADGSRLGDNEDMIRLMIEFGREWKSWSN